MTKKHPIEPPVKVGDVYAHTAAGPVKNRANRFDLPRVHGLKISQTARFGV